MKNILYIIIILSLTFSAGMAADKAPDFTLNDLEGGKFSLYEALKNGPVLVNFWATWCKPCLQELPHVQRIHETYSKEGLQVVAISIDSPKSRAKVRPYTKAAGFQFSVLLDSDSEVRKLFGGTSMPFNAIIAPNGDIFYQHLGYVPGDEKAMEEAVVNLLKKWKQDNANPNEE